MALRRVLTAAPLDLGDCEPHEVLVVSTDPELLAEAGRLGLHRLVAEPGDADEQVAELEAFLAR